MYKNKKKAGIGALSDGTAEQAGKTDRASLLYERVFGVEYTQYVCYNGSISKKLLTFEDRYNTIVTDTNNCSILKRRIDLWQIVQI